MRSWSGRPSRGHEGRRPDGRLQRRIESVKGGASQAKPSATGSKPSNPKKRAPAKKPAPTRKATDAEVPDQHHVQDGGESTESPEGVVDAPSDPAGEVVTGLPPRHPASSIELQVTRSANVHRGSRTYQGVGRRPEENHQYGLTMVMATVTQSMVRTAVGMAAFPWPMMIGGIRSTHTQWCVQEIGLDEQTGESDREQPEGLSPGDGAYSRRRRRPSRPWCRGQQ